MNWLTKLSEKIRISSVSKKEVPEGLWRQCDECSAVLYRPELERNGDVCPKCQHHFRLSARKRLDYFLDETPRHEIAADVKPVDRLKFRDTKKYKDRLMAAQKATGEKDALVVMRGAVKGVPVVAAAFEFYFIGGSMGAVVGEKFVQAAEAALQAHIPLVCFSASGGARMQEALLSLMQMAKTSAVLSRLDAAAIPFISVLCDPTMGGVSASLAMLGDIIIAEPKALVGFTGPRVIEQIIRESLPEGFQRAECLLEHGTIDMIVHRPQLRDTVSGLLQKLLHARS